MCLSLHERDERDTECPTSSSSFPEDKSSVSTLFLIQSLSLSPFLFLLLVFCHPDVFYSREDIMMIIIVINQRQEGQQKSDSPTQATLIDDNIHRRKQHSQRKEGKDKDKNRNQQDKKLQSNQILLMGVNVELFFFWSLPSSLSSSSLKHKSFVTIHRICLINVLLSGEGIFCFSFQPFISSYHSHRHLPQTLSYFLCCVSSTSRVFTEDKFTGFCSS